MNEKGIEELLREARHRAAGFGRTYGQKETADDFLKLTYAQLYRESRPTGTVAERDAWVKNQKEYKEAVERKRDAYADFKTAETYLKLLFAEVEVWRTNQANNRWLDKAHT